MLPSYQRMFALHEQFLDGLHHLSTMAQVADSESVNEPTLLSVPPEIRNIIYRIVLVEGKIHGGTFEQLSPQPALLQVNRQVRQEALSIFYRENQFVWHILDYRAKEYIKWSRSSAHRRRARYGFQCTGRLRRMNLLRWLEAVYKDQADCPGGTKTAARPAGGTVLEHEAVVYRLFKMVRSMRDRRGLTWEQVRSNIDHVRGMLASASSKFL